MAAKAGVRCPDVGRADCDTELLTVMPPVKVVAISASHSVRTWHAEGQYLARYDPRSESRAARGSSEMAETPTRKRRPRGSIDPEKILDGAFEIASRDGLDNLSMPGLAGHLDVGVTSIYWYFRNKDDLLRQMNARAIKDDQSTSVSVDDFLPENWRAFMYQHSNSSRERYRQDDLRIDLMLMKTSAYSGTATKFIYQGVEDALAFLVKAGFELTTAWYVYSTLSVYTRGFAIAERNRRHNQTPPEGRPQLNLLDAAAMPLLTALVAEDDGVIIDMTGDESFEFGLNMILDSAERLRERDIAAR
ncbi:TetR/AcrR family transcriptional regulator C-terminal domain-containing protein [Microbacterium sp.]|uniref:TetR/AcrR family transcriptional regulator C-terminal domain-containing protein n=1 Tax=Microbacterium sp. TaxID=51671 RepID=UPI0027335B4F|nr:TetR/AcrR family transcriptional regulator C-terminal domain-containing protein [Microbacterium sp.]MDP3949211.1 TetR/AcrR family transcriptional regulator C-terminal domain-containing protein [Microbacterium sp.]